MVHDCAMSALDDSLREEYSARVQEEDPSDYSFLSGPMSPIELWFRGLAQRAPDYLVSRSTSIAAQVTDDAENCIREIRGESIGKVQVVGEPRSRTPGQNRHSAGGFSTHDCSLCHEEAR